MNTNKTITNCRKVGGDYFRLVNVRNSNLHLKDFVDEFNFDDYWCFKTTNYQRLINEKDFLDFKYASYTFFKKSLYDKDKIIEWCKMIGGIQYLVKPTPPFSPKNIELKINRLLKK